MQRKARHSQLLLNRPACFLILDSVGDTASQGRGGTYFLLNLFFSFVTFFSALLLKLKAKLELSQSSTSTWATPVIPTSLRPLVIITGGPPKQIQSYSDWQTTTIKVLLYFTLFRPDFHRRAHMRSTQKSFCHGKSSIPCLGIRQAVLWVSADQGIFYYMPPVRLTIWCHRK